jgi:prepilin-type N-terminal cleavage/methylation domain-containing protein
MRRAGFTLLEVVMVLAVIGVAAAIAVPRWAAWDHVALDAAAWRLAERLSAARSDAVLAGETRQVDLAVPAGVEVVRVDVGGLPAEPTGRLALAAEGDAQPARVTLADRAGRTRVVVLPAGVGRARVEPEDRP